MYFFVYFQTAAGRPEQFFLFSSILEATMIDKRHCEKPISFELSIGEHTSYQSFISMINITYIFHTIIAISWWLPENVQAHRAGNQISIPYPCR